MNDDVDARTRRRRWLVFGLACAVSWLLYVHRYAWGVIKPAFKAEYPELSDVEIGWLDSLFLITYAIGQVPGGMAGDFFGPRIVLTILLVWWSGSVAAIAWSGTYTQFGVSRAMFGLAQAGTYPNLSKVTQSWFSVSIRTTVQGLVATLSGRAGGACASLIVATLLMHQFGLGWRTSLLVLAAGGIVLGVLFCVFFRNSPESVGQAACLPDETAGQRPAPRAKLALTPGGAVTLTALLFYAAFSTFADQLFVFWIPQFLVEGKGLSQAEMGVFASLPLWGGAIGGLVGGMLNDVLIRWTGSRRWGRASIAMIGKSLGAVFIASSLVVEDGRWVMVVLAACKFFNDWSLSSQWGALTDVGGRATGTIFGIVNTSGSVAAIGAGPIMGWLKQEYGWETLFLTVAGVYVVAALCWLLIDSSQKLTGSDES